MTGIFITIEGCEGVGKSTQIRLLKKYIEESGQKALFTREPGGTDVAEKIRGILLNGGEISPLTEAYLFAAARADHMERLILPALARGETVICDRFIDSSLAYQGYARGLGEEKVYEINAPAISGRMPDCTVFIDMDPAVSWRKQKGASVAHDRMENECAEFHDCVYKGFLALAEKEARFVRVVPDKDKTATHRAIVEALRERGCIK